jgi:hypothetical protein
LVTISCLSIFKLSILHLALCVSFYMHLGSSRRRSMLCYTLNVLNSYICQTLLSSWNHLKERCAYLECSNVPNSSWDELYFIELSSYLLLVLIHTSFRSSHLTAIHLIYLTLSLGCSFFILWLANLQLILVTFLRKRLL